MFRKDPGIQVQHEGYSGIADAVGVYLIPMGIGQPADAVEFAGGRNLHAPAAGIVGIRFFQQGAPRTQCAVCEQLDRAYGEPVGYINAFSDKMFGIFFPGIEHGVYAHLQAAGLLQRIDTHHRFIIETGIANGSEAHCKTSLFRLQKGSGFLSR